MKEEIKKDEKVQNKKKPKVNKEVEKLTLENKALQEKILRISADMQNSLRRGEEEISRIRKYEGANILKDILPIVDNFERALKLDDDNLDDELSKFLSGFKMIYTNLVNILQSFDIKEIEAKDKKFDSSLMEAVLTEKKDGTEKDIVLEVLQKGYMYKDKLLRPAMVKVSE